MPDELPSQHVTAALPAAVRLQIGARLRLPRALPEEVEQAVRLQHAYELEVRRLRGMEARAGQQLGLVRGERAQRPARRLAASRLLLERVRQPRARQSLRLLQLAARVIRKEHRSGVRGALELLARHLRSRLGKDVVEQLGQAELRCDGWRAVFSWPVV